MSRAPTTGKIMGRSSGNDLTGSMLEEIRAIPIEIPDDVPKKHHEPIRKLYETNPHWDINQMQMVIRLVAHRELIKNLYYEVEQDGHFIETAAGGLKSHPGLNAITAIEGKISMLERALALTIQARNASIPKKDREKTIRRDEADRPIKAKKGAPIMRLA